MRHTFYHYTTLTRAGQMLGKYTPRGSSSGLQPKKAIGRNRTVTEAAAQKAAFGLLEPLPQKWINNEHFPSVWAMLVDEVDGPYGDKVLMEVAADTSRDKIYVGDRGTIERALHTQDGDFEALRREGEDLFVRTMLPLEEYVAGETSGNVNFSLPEVVILQTISAEALTVSHAQPLLESELLHGTSLITRRALVHGIKDGHIQEELMPWKTAFEAVHGALGGFARRR